VKLRDYQQDIINRTRASLANHRASLVVMATGGGKTALTVSMMASAAARGNSSIFCVHRDTLLSQTSRALWQQHVQHGVIAAGRVMSPERVQVASVQTLVRRLARVQPPDLLVIDEAHRAAAETYRRIIMAYPRAKIVGLTATPARTDGRGLGDVFDDLVIGPDVAELMERGYLCRYRILAPDSDVDMSGSKIQMGDYATADVEAAVDRPTVTGDAVATYLKHATGSRCIVFCASLKHARHVRDSYLSAGVAAEYMDGDTPSGEREAILGRLARGETKILTNVDLVIEGVDVPAVECVQWLRPTASLIIWMQGNGRGFRPADGKSSLLIMDHVKNWQRHGLPDDAREWTLHGQPKRKRGAVEREITAKQCAKCYAVFQSGPTACPNCGEPLAGEPRLIQEVAGDLIELNLTAVRLAQAAEAVAKRKEQGAARTLADLVALAIRRGQKKPAEWAAIVAAARQGGRKPRPDEFKRAKDIYSQLQGSAW
jgi:DNA repair protein RadD